MSNFDFFWRNLPKNGTSCLKQKKERHHRFQDIRNSLGSKFQVKETILNFWTKFGQKYGYYLNPL